MDINDFNGINKFKIILPLLYIVNWISMIFGPIFFSTSYSIMCMLVFIYTDIKILLVLGTMIMVTIQSNKIFRKTQEYDLSSDAQNKQQMDTSQSIYYGFIIPNYNQTVALIAETLDVLASHKRAQERYLIFLAMEEDEQGSLERALQLISGFKNKFKLIDFTQHQIQQNEFKKKAANVAWCAQHLHKSLQRNKINPQNLMLTVMDVDSWVADAYIDQMEDHLIKNHDMRHSVIYQAPQIFTKNQLEVPIFTRVADIMHSYVHCSSLYSIFKLTFPLVNYSMSYQLLKRIGFLDTCFDAVGDDLHTTQKAFWKTGGEIITVPIYVPFNLLNITSEKGYVADVKAKWRQCVRNTEGCADVAYCFKMLFSKKFRTTNLIMFFLVFETFALPTVLPWVFLSTFIQALFSSNDFLPHGSLPVFLGIIIVGNTLAYLLYEIFKRRSNTIFYHGQNQTILRIFEFLIVLPVNLFLMYVPAFILSAFRIMWANKKYVINESKESERREIGLEIEKNGII